MESSPSTGTAARTAGSEALGKALPPFKLCFPVKCMAGRSGRNYPTAVMVVSPKFYSRTCYSFCYSERSLQCQMQRLKFVGPREKYESPITESQRYGWYQVRLCTPDKSNKRINFAKNTHQLVKEHLMNYAKIRD